MLTNPKQQTSSTRQPKRPHPAIPSPERPIAARLRNGRFDIQRIRKRTEQRGHLLNCLRHLKIAVEKDGFDFGQLVADI